MEQNEHAASSARWAVLVPIKELHLAKSRLVPPHGVARENLALAMALDVISAASASTVVERVIAITNDARARSAVDALGASWVEDDPDSGLNPALTHAADHARSLGFANVVAISSDLPSLDSDALTDFLIAIAPGSRAIVRDAHDTGTALLAATTVDLLPQFGHQSANAHVTDGATDETGRITHAGLRRDVDTIDDLIDAQRIGVGPHTRALLDAAPATTGAQMSDTDGTLVAAGQATVRTWDEASGALTAVRDDGTLLEIGAEAFLSSPLMRLRPGQRIRLESRGGTIARVSLLTM